jgi:hypothetical protein
VLRALTENSQRVKGFEGECTEAFGVMRNSLQEQYRKTEMYEQKVQTRMEEFEIRVFEEDLVRLEKDRDQMEKEMTQKIIEFNFKVHEDAVKLDQEVKSELYGLRQELVREQQVRADADQALLKSVTNFLINLQQ